MHRSDKEIGLVTYCHTCNRAFEPDPEGIFFNPRGMGVNCLSCFVCNQKPERTFTDMASFVRGKANGDKLVALFRQYNLYPHLDFRSAEPNWVQFKLGACKQHEPNLTLLYLLTTPRLMITPKMIRLVGGHLDGEER